MIRNVFLDADDTLFDFHKSERRALTATLNCFGIAPEEPILARYSEINRAQWKLLECKQITRDALKVRRYSLLLDELGRQDISADAMAKRYEEELSHGHYFLEGAENLLRALHGTYRLYLASNGNTGVQRGRLASAGIAPYFSDIFISQEMGADKPSAAYFDACFERIPDFRREETVIVGDSLTSDVRGGRNAGIRTVWYCPVPKQDTENILPDYIIRHLCELPELLKHM